MNTKPTKKQWTRTEWLLLAPLVIVVGIGAMNFAPQLGRAWREWREYGNDRPYAVFYPETKSKDPNDQTLFYPIAFSSDSKKVAGAEYEHSKLTTENYRVSVWDVVAQQQLSSWALAKSQINKLEFVNDRLRIEQRNFPPTRNYIEERDLANGHLLSIKKDANLSSSKSPASMHSVFTFYERSYNIAAPKLEKLGNTLFYVKVYPVKTPVKSSPELSSSTSYLVKWIAQIYDQNKQAIKKPFLLKDHFYFYWSGGSNTSSAEFCISPDGKTIITNIETRLMNNDVKTRQNQTRWVEAFDVRSGRLLWKQEMTRRMPVAVAFSPSSAITAIPTRNSGSSKITGTIELRDTRTGTILRQMQTRSFDVANWIIEQMQFSPDGKLLAVPQDDRLELWDVSDLN